MKNFFITVLCVITLCFGNKLQAQINGIVFQDFNGNGIKDNIASSNITVGLQDIPIKDVIVKAFNSFDALIAQQVTNSQGNYSFPIGTFINQIPTNTPVRIEYVLPNNCLASNNFMFSGLGAYNYGSNVQFVTQSTTPTTVNFALHDPNKFRASSNNPIVFVTRLSNGNPIAPIAGNTATASAFYSFNYTASARNTTGNSSRTSLATAAQIGSCWGIAFNKLNSRVYTSALVKRLSGLGPGGALGTPNPINAPGAIYEINPSIANSGKFFFSMDALGPYYYTHSHTAGNLMCVKDNVSRGLLNSLSSASADATVFDQVGKTGIGDIELSDDGRYLWLTNLYDQKLYRIDLSSGTNPVAPTPATASALITSWNLPNLSITNGVLRPWGLKYYHNKIYVGVVNSGETHPAANSTTNVNTNYDATTVTGGSFNTGNANVLEFNPVGAGTWNNILTIPLNYPRGNAADENYNVKRWFNWANSSAIYSIGTGGNAQIRPQPILSSIEFDVEGSLMIAFMDRLANQSGLHAWDESGMGDFYGESGGDLLRAYNNGCGIFELESNGKEGLSSPKPATAGANHGQGPGSGVFPLNPNYVNDTNYGTGYGEFYFKDKYQFSPTFIPHNETNLGSIAFLPGSNELMSTVMDPFDINSNGVMRFSNITGDSLGGYELIPYAELGTFAKSASIGDIEFLQSNPPIEIGNRVWSDANNDGIQSAEENGMAGVTLQLYHPASNTVVGTVTTNPNGGYYFSSSSGTSVQGITYNLNIQPFTNYIVRLATSGVGSAWDPTGNGGLGAPIVGGVLTGTENALTGVIGNGNFGQSDNDAIMVNGVPSVLITTGNYGESNLNIDFGFKPAAPVTAKMVSFIASPKNEKVELVWNVREQSNVKKYTVEHSKDAVNFYSVGDVYATINTQEVYSFIHNKSVNAINYYRIKTVDNNGTFAYSVIRRVEFGNKLEIKTYPNPTKDYVYISLPTKSLNKPIAISLINTIGVAMQRVVKPKASQTESLDLNRLPSGTYFIIIESEGEKVKRLIVVTK
jgi:SdrD B-like domain/Secretion system C-terminal sorting domain